MERARIFLLSALFLLAFMLWTAWENDSAKKTPVPQTSGQTAPQAIPNLAVVSPLAQASAIATMAPATTLPVATRLIEVHTDVLDVAIDPVGGNVVQANLIKYPQTLNSPVPYPLLSNNSDKLYVAQSGVIGTGGPDSAQAQARYSSSQASYTLAPGQDQLTVELKWRGSNGLIVNKIFTFARDKYAIGVNYRIDNNSAKTWTGQFYMQLQRKKLPAKSHGLFMVTPYVGGAISSPDKPYTKLSFAKMTEENLNMPVQGGWEAMLEHYFLSAWVPNNAETFNYYSQAQGDVYTLGMIGPLITVAPGAKSATYSKLYLGPESMDRLKTVAPNLDLTIDYGILWFIAIAVFWLMRHIYQVVGNWGWSIVLVTMLIKLLFYHLSAKSYRSMAAMRRLQPRLQSLKERYGDDRQKMTQATMELYKKEKINPVSGCLPILVQIPVFIALYWVLLESVELRQAPFIWWLHDLSTKDPYYVLPIIMGLSMFVQQRLNPPPPDPVQARMMQILPIFFTFLFLSFPSGLVLYWVVNNSLSILQQWYITRSMEVAEKSKKTRA